MWLDFDVAEDETLTLSPAASSRQSGAVLWPPSVRSPKVCRVLGCSVGTLQRQVH
jgi:hypothetical protein